MIVSERDAPAESGSGTIFVIFNDVTDDTKVTRIRGLDMIGNFTENRPGIKNVD